MAVTTTKDSWHADHWFGSIATLADAAEVAELELGEIDGDVQGAERVLGITHYTSATVNYDGGSFQADTLKELREALSDLEGREGIESVFFHVETPKYSAMVSALSSGGVSVNVEGPRATPVHGLVSTLQRKLEPGVGRVRQQPIEPFGAERVVFLVVGWTAGLGMGYLAIHSAVKYGVDFGWVLLLILCVFGPLVGTAYFLDRDRLPPLHLQLVSEADEDSPPPQADERGPILRARDWLRRHPLLGLLGALALAVVANLITNAIT